MLMTTATNACRMLPAFLGLDSIPTSPPFSVVLSTALEARYQHLLGTGVIAEVRELKKLYHIATVLQVELGQNISPNTWTSPLSVAVTYASANRFTK